MKIFKGYTKNHHRPEDSIVERYTIQEVFEFCSNYLSETESIGVPKSRHADRFGGVDTQCLNFKSMAWDLVLEARARARTHTHTHTYIIIIIIIILVKLNLT